MTDQETAVSMVRGLGQELGIAVPAEQAVELGAFLLSKLGGKSWDEARAAGAEAAARIKTEADAETARRQRLQEE